MPLDVESLSIPEVKLIRPKRHGDSRGFFSETYNKRAFAEAGIEIDFVQDNHAYSATANTVRGLHFQTHPWAQHKLVRVVRGAILDVAVDLRHGSPSFGQHVRAEISARAWNQILVPIGFAHGLRTLEPDTEVLYKVSNYYAPEHDAGLLWTDPALGIDWGLDPAEAQLSDRDRRWPRLAELPRHFDYGHGDR
jgi:dTDP-4-dehydrorhamnose 3,5-epimerase